MRKRRYLEDETEINITPMLDIVFIMLIFFIVTSSFMKEQGLEISRPSNLPPQQVEVEKGPIVVRINSTSQVSIDGRMLEPRAVQANLERQKAERPESPLIVAAHPDADTESVVRVLDAARSVGIGSVNVSTSSEP